MIRYISLTDAQRRLSRLVDEAFWCGTIHLLTHRGEPRAAIVPLSMLDLGAEGDETQDEQDEPGA